MIDKSGNLRWSLNRRLFSLDRGFLASERPVILRYDPFAIRIKSCSLEILASHLFLSLNHESGTGLIHRKHHIQAFYQVFTSTRSILIYSHLINTAAMPSSDWVSCRPEDDDEPERFSERSDGRRKLFEDASRRLPTASLSPLVWAFFQVGNLESLQELCQNKASWNNVFNESKKPVFEMEAKDAIRLWRQARQEKDTTLTPSKRSASTAFGRSTTSSPPLRLQATSLANPPRTRSPMHRSGTVATQCKQREGLCAVTRQSALEACLIYPHCAFDGGNPRVRSYWDILRFFWPLEKVDSWRAKIFGDDTASTPLGTETIQNMLTLTVTLHRWHSEGAFALRPVRMSNDKTRLELEFHWLAQQQRDPTASVDLMEQPASSRDLPYSRRGAVCCRFEDVTKPTLLISGTRFTMTTEDPVNLPLPDAGLLEMQWHLQRVVAMTGAAGWTEEDFDYEDPIEEWMGGQSDDLDRQSRGSSPIESVEIVDPGYNN